MPAVRHNLHLPPPPSCLPLPCLDASALLLLGTEYCRKSRSLDLGLSDLVELVGQKTGLYGSPPPTGTDSSHKHSHTHAFLVYQQISCSVTLGHISLQWRHSAAIATSLAKNIRPPHLDLFNYTLISSPVLSCPSAYVATSLSYSLLWHDTYPLLLTADTSQ